MSKVQLRKWETGKKVSEANQRIQTIDNSIKNMKSDRLQNNDEFVVAYSDLKLLVNSIQEDFDDGKVQFTTKKKGLKTKRPNLWSEAIYFPDDSQPV